jgi:hypothetical protein
MLNSTQRHLRQGSELGLSAAEEILQNSLQQVHKKGPKPCWPHPDRHRKGRKTTKEIARVIPPPSPEMVTNSSFNDHRSMCARQTQDLGFCITRLNDQYERNCLRQRDQSDAKPIEKYHRQQRSNANKVNKSTTTRLPARKTTTRRDITAANK